MGAPRPAVVGLGQAEVGGMADGGLEGGLVEGALHPERKAGDEVAREGSSVGLPHMYLGMIQAPRRIARNVASAKRELSTARSVAEFPIPSTSTRLPPRTSGSR